MNSENITTAIPAKQGRGGGTRQILVATNTPNANNAGTVILQKTTGGNAKAKKTNASRKRKATEDDDDGRDQEVNENQGRR